MKTTFGRLFGLIAGLVLLCVLFLGAGFRALLSNYLISAARESLSNNAQAVAELASAYDTTGQLEDNWDFRMSLSFASLVAENDAVICDENGKVILCSCEDIACPHLGTQLDPGLTAAVLLGGETYAKGDLENLYNSTRYYVATPVVSRSTGESIGFVVVSTPAEEAAQLMGPMFQIFLITAGVVLLALVLFVPGLTSLFSDMEKLPLAADQEGRRSDQDACDEVGDHGVSPLRWSANRRRRRGACRRSW